MFRKIYIQQIGKFLLAQPLSVMNDNEKSDNAPVNGY